MSGSPPRSLIEMLPRGLSHRKCREKRGADIVAMQGKMGYQTVLGD